MLRPTLLWLVALLLITGCSAGESSRCPPGSQGCPCDAAGTCEPGLACLDSTCVVPPRSHLQINATAARACEVLISDATAAILSVQAADSVEARHKRRAGNVAVSFMQTRDEPFPSQAVSLQLSAGAAVERVRVASSRCWGRLGDAITGAGVSLVKEP